MDDLSVQKDLIREHALECVPEEACGYVLLDGQLLRGRNRSPKPDRSFAIDGLTVKKAAERGAALIYHSHPSGTSEPSEMDKLASKRAGLPYLVYGVEENRFSYFDPKEPWEALVGLPWDPPRRDCFTLVRDYMRVARGVEVEDHERPQIEEAEGYQFPDHDLFYALREELGFESVEGPPVEGDIISFRIHSKTENHLAVVLGDRILHHVKGQLSRVEDFRPLYRKLVARIYRWRGDA